MIDDLKTTEEILEYVRQQSRQSTTIVVESNGNERPAVFRTATDANDETGNDFNGTHGTSYSNSDRTRTNESGTGSIHNTDDTVSNIAERLSGNYSSVDKRDERLAATPEYVTATATEHAGHEEYAQPARPVTPPTKKSRFSFFKPYKDAIDEHKKQAEKQKKQTAKNTRRVFTDTEARVKRDKLVEVLLWQSEHADQLIIAISKGHADIIIWSDIDKDDAETLADFLLARARVDRRIATVVDQMLEIQNRLEVAIIVLPRVWRTLTHIFTTGISFR